MRTGLTRKDKEYTAVFRININVSDYRHGLTFVVVVVVFSTGHLFKKWVDLSRENCRKDELSQGSSNGIRGYIRKSYVALIEEREGGK